MHSPALRTPGRAAPALLAVAGLHLLLAALLASMSTWRDRAPGGAAPPPLTVWLLRQLAPAPAAAALPTRPSHPMQTGARRPGAAAQAITLPALTANAAAEPTASPTPASAGAGPTTALDAATPLNLTLPKGASAPWRQRSPVLDDERGRSARATFESLLAGAMGGDGRWTEERIDQDRIRFRRGNTCVDMERGRGERIDSFNSSFSPKPWLAGKPSPC